MCLLKYLLRFEVKEFEISEHHIFDFSFDMSEVYLKYYKHCYFKEEKYFFMSLQDLYK